VTISLVVAVAENGVIGRGGGLPWHLPDDLVRFKELTSGSTIVMGRKTFESIGRPLPNRQNIVLTRDRAFESEGVELVHELENVLLLDDRECEIFVIGGAEVFGLLLPYAERLYQTVVHAAVEGDTHFDEIDKSEWELCQDEFHDADQQHEHPFSFRLWVRRAQRPAS
jgi:dihydrofolate reductase